MYFHHYNTFEIMKGIVADKQSLDRLKLTKLKIRYYYRLYTYCPHLWLIIVGNNLCQII